MQNASTASTTPFVVADERARRTASTRAAAVRRQPMQCAAIAALTTQLTPTTMCDEPERALRALIDLRTLVDEQAAALTSTAPEHWRRRAAAHFGTERQFTLAYADPPWRYKANNRQCSTEPHYETMADDELAALPVRGLLHADSAVALWATAPKFDVAVRLLALWGYEFRTVLLTWIKVTASGQHPIYATGAAYTRPCAEFLLLGVRGNLHVTARANRMIDSVLETRRAEHSHKPGVVRDILVALFGDRTRIELFTRETVPGWHAWGNETTKFNELYALGRPGEAEAGSDNDDGGEGADEEDDDGEIEELSAKRARLLPIRPGRSRANNRSAKKTLPKKKKGAKASARRGLPIGTRDAGPASINSYYNKPSDGTKMTINDFILRGYDNSELRQYNRVTDLRALFGTAATNAERHSTYPTMTVDEARAAEPLLRRVQEHNDEMLFAANANTTRRPVRYTDGEIAALLDPQPPGGALTRSEDELLNGDVPEDADAPEL